MAKDTALDNLWNTTDDTYVYKTIGSRPAKMSKKVGGSLIGKRTKLQGYLTYFLPKDKKGKVIGKPQKFLRLQKAGQTTNDFVPFDLVTPYYEDIVKNKNYWIAMGGKDVVFYAQNRLSGFEQNPIASKFSGVDAKDFGLNSNLLDTGSLSNVNSNNHNDYSSISAVEMINNPDISVVDADTMNKAYKESGSKSKFSDWLNSEGGRGIVNEFTKLVDVVVNKPLPTDSTSTNKTDTKK